MWREGSTRARSATYPNSWGHVVIAKTSSEPVIATRHPLQGRGEFVDLSPKDRDLYSKEHLGEMSNRPEV